MERIKAALDRMDMTIGQWLLAISCIVAGRYFLETLSDPTYSGIIGSNPAFLVHYFLFFISISLGLMLILALFMPLWKKHVPVLMLFLLPISFLAPVIDWIVSGGRGIVMSYIFVTPAELGRSFLGILFRPILASGITIGMRVEVAVFIICIALIVYAVRRDVRSAVLAALAAYAVTFVYAIVPDVPSYIAALFGAGTVHPAQFLQTAVLGSATLADSLHGAFRYASLGDLVDNGFSFLIGRLWYVIAIALSAWWFMLLSRKRFVAILKNSRPEAALHYMGLAAIGALIAYHQSRFSLNWNDWLTMAILLASLCLSWMSAVCLNDIHDVELDRISNASRPLPSDLISRADMRTAAVIFFVAAMIGALLCGYYACMFVLVCNALSYLYSVPPMRFKRIPVLSAFVISACCLLPVMAGFFTLSASKAVSAFPPTLIAGIFAIYILHQHFRGIRDIDADRSAGVMTVAAMFGRVHGPRVAGALTAISYLIAPLIIREPILFIVAIPAAVVTYILAVKKPYAERPIFAIYGISVLIGAVMLLA